MTLVSSITEDTLHIDTFRRCDSELHVPVPVNPDTTAAAQARRVQLEEEAAISSILKAICQGVSAPVFKGKGNGTLIGFLACYAQNTPMINYNHAPGAAILFPPVN